MMISDAVEDIEGRAAMMPDQFAFTDLSERLEGPEGAKVAEQARARLGELKDLAARRLDEGVPSDQYEKLLALSNALATAQRIMILLSSPRSKEARGVGDIPGGAEN